LIRLEKGVFSLSSLSRSAGSGPQPPRVRNFDEQEDLNVLEEDGGSLNTRSQRVGLLMALMPPAHGRSASERVDVTAVAEASSGQAQVPSRHRIWSSAVNASGGDREAFCLRC
jgi:hypothetical protein